jgi:hypothetical protein
MVLVWVNIPMTEPPRYRVFAYIAWFVARPANC